MDVQLLDASIEAIVNTASEHGLHPQVLLDTAIIFTCQLADDAMQAIPRFSQQVHDEVGRLYRAIEEVESIVGII